jgi:hypothetical protein
VVEGYDRCCHSASCYASKGFLLASNNWCRMQGLRRKKGATCLPGATSEKGIFTSNKKNVMSCAGCARGDRRCGPAWRNRGERGFLHQIKGVMHVQCVRGETGATSLPGTTSEKGILAPNKKGVMCRVCGGRQVLRACLAPQGRRVIFYIQ